MIHLPYECDPGKILVIMIFLKIEFLGADSEGENPMMYRVECSFLTVNDREMASHATTCTVNYRWMISSNKIVTSIISTQS